MLFHTPELSPDEIISTICQLRGVVRDCGSEEERGLFVIEVDERSDLTALAYNIHRLNIVTEHLFIRDRSGSVCMKYANTAHPPHFESSSPEEIYQIRAQNKQCENSASTRIEAILIGTDTKQDINIAA